MEESRTRDLVGDTIRQIRIESRIGVGGMGEVYAGYDERLERRVALKTIRGRRRFDERARARFLREARILSKLEHPGICRIYDLIEEEACDFLVLEYIDGETLAATDGHRLDHAERLEIAERIALALAGAHAASVVHRDLKPENVMLTRDGEVKVLDFGLSRSVGAAGVAVPRDAEDGVSTEEGEGPGTSEASGSGPQITRVGSVVGTLRYMSPEQARSEEATEASDLYSLGIVLHELFTGYNPYPPEANPAELVRRVSRAEPDPVAGTDPDLAALIRELESLDPSSRPPAAEVADRLRWIRAKPERDRRRRWTLLGVVAALVAVAAAVALTLHLSGTGRGTVRRPEGRIVVLPFENRTGEASLDWVTTGIPELLVRALEPLRGVELVPGEQVREAVRTLGLPAAGVLSDPAASARLMTALGAELIVAAGVEREAEGIRIVYRLDGPSGTLSGRSVSALRPTTAGERLAEELARVLGLGAVDGAPEGDPFARQAYAIGVHLQNTAGPRDARPFFEVAEIRDPDLAWSRLRRAECLEKLGEWDEAEGLAEELLGTEADREDRALVSTAHTLLGSIASSQGRYEVAEDHLSQALALERAAGRRGGEARVLFFIAKMAYTRGDYEAAIPRFEAALAGHRRAGDHPGELDSLNHLGLVALNRGELASAVERFERVRALAERYGDRRREALARVNLGNVAQKDGRDDEAEALWREALAGLRASGDRRNELIVLNNLGVLALEQGDDERARATYEELVELSEGLGDRVAEAAAHLNLALALLGTGETQAAREHLDRVQGLDTWVREHAETYLIRAQLELREGRPKEALELALESRRRAGEGWTPGRQELLEEIETAARKAS